MLERALTQIEFQSVPDVLHALDRLEIDIQKAPSLDALRTLEDVVAGIQRRWKPVKDVADRAGELWIEAEAKAKGTRGTARGRDGSGGIILSLPEGDAPSRRELQLSKRQATRAGKLAQMGQNDRRVLISELKADGKAVTPNTALAFVRSKAKAERKHELAAATFSSEGPFDAVVIDPPWPMQKIDREARPNQDAFDYPVMSEQELTKFWQGEIAPKLKDDCHVFCWTTQKYLRTAIQLAEGWGLRHMLVMVWYKNGGFQPVDLPQYNCEFIVYARKGNPLFIDTRDFPCCFEGERREHSRKPDHFYDMVRRVTGGSRIDVFSREQREGFAQYGNEPDRFTEAAECA